jgi:hypothetical protein
MGATAAQIAELRRMVAEPTVTTYSDALLTTYIERYPVLDEQGEDPYTLDSASPPAQEVNTSWIPTYDMNAAAADVWHEKAGTVAANYDFTADGGNYSMSQQYKMYTDQARFYLSRRKLKTTRMVKKPDEPSADVYLWIGNLAEPTD